RGEHDRPRKVTATTLADAADEFLSTHRVGAGGAKETSECSIR
ncbi:MAG: hypothetical protein K0R62_2959, partial [Nonomuraea muscovyensis]|nr:hypothetical protein [Nonomuraea muscovyensis]